MSHTSLFLLMLGLVVLALVSLAYLLIQHLTQMTESTSQKLLDFQEKATISQMRLLEAAHETQKSSLTQLLTAQSELFVPMLHQQEILVNRVMAKEAVAVQALDVRLMQEKNLGESNPEEIQTYESHTADPEEEYRLDDDSMLYPG